MAEITPAGLEQLVAEEGEVLHAYRDVAGVWTIGVGLTALELIVILVQAYVFTLLTAVFIGMAIHAHH